MLLNKTFHTKHELRILARKIRADLDINSISKDIFVLIQKQNFYKESLNILSFYPFNTEIDLKELYRDSSKSWYLPRVKPDSYEMTIHPYKYGDILENNKYSVPEPVSQETDPKIIDLAIIPAVVVDKKGYRLGYGAGYYDRFIPSLRQDCLKVVPVPEGLLIDKIPHDEFDIPINCAVTEKNVYKFC